MMHKNVKRYLGFDCGNSSVRTVLGTFDGDTISLELIHKVPNQEYRGIQYDYWDILAIFHEMIKGMKLACDTYPDIASFGISTWGIDFGLLGTSGELLSNPLCYRNVLGSQGMAKAGKETQDALFALTGIQNMPMNSLYQLLGIQNALPEYYEMAKKLLLIPDLLNHLFTGEMNSEVSIASTTQLLSMRDRSYSDDVFAAVHLNRDLFVPMVRHGLVRGTLREDLSLAYKIPRLQAISVPAHDTASAVVSVPSVAEQFAFISSGTWSLIGTELPEAIINDSVQRLGFSNEGGVFDTITLLKNSCGMHILQNIKREMEFNDNRSYSWEEIVDMSKPTLQQGSAVSFDPNHESLYHPDSMITAIRNLCGLSTLGEIIASAYYSLATSYKTALDDLERITNTTYDTVHIIGGGARNDHLNQMTADLTGKRVVTGPEEATSLGVIALQVMHDFPDVSLTDIRKIVRNSTHLGEYVPRH